MLRQLNLSWQDPPFCPTCTVLCGNPALTVGPAGDAQVPAGSLPRTMEVIFRNDIVEQARAGDKLVFCGSLVVVPDVSVITAPGQRNVMKGAGAARACSGSP